MATNNRKSVAPPEATPEIEAKAQELGAKVAEKAPTQESIYPADELARAHKVFDTSYEIVAVALKLAGKETATVTEAREIINEFMKKEVK